jgi:hypothetical protein
MESPLKKNSQSTKWTGKSWDLTPLCLLFYNEINFLNLINIKEVVYV